MNKELAVEVLEILSALESWSFSTKCRLPDYLYERLDNTIRELRTIILTPPQTYNRICEAEREVGDVAPSLPSFRAGSYF